MLNKDVLRNAGVAVGDTVDVRFRVEAPDAVDVPDVLQRALDGGARALPGWNALSPGKRRGLAYRVASAKTVPTRLRRLGEVLVALREGEVV